ncbi:MAG: hypothetical protein K0Q68_322 [Moraxellaceae bacterium]|jgi:uncharacterized protein YcfL|nr:hypothetical protein [Moraxellaceae bacterium]
MRLIRLPLLAGSLLLLSACQSRPAPEFLIQEPAVDLHTQPGQVAVIQPASRVVGSANAIQVIGLKTITDGSRLLVEATLRNDRGRRDIVYYRLRWLDSAGVMLGQYEPWATESLDGLQQAVITATSPYPHAVDFRLEIRSKD